MLETFQVRTKNGRRSWGFLALKNLDLFLLAILYGLYHGIHHHLSPFGGIFLELFPFASWRVANRWMDFDLVSGTFLFSWLRIVPSCWSSPVGLLVCCFLFGVFNFIIIFFFGGGVEVLWFKIYSEKKKMLEFSVARNSVHSCHCNGISGELTNWNWWLSWYEYPAFALMKRRLANFWPQVCD